MSMGNVPLPSLLTRSRSEMVPRFWALAKLLHCVHTAWALRALAGKITQDHLPPVC